MSIPRRKKLSSELVLGNPVSLAVLSSDAVYTHFIKIVAKESEFTLGEKLDRLLVKGPILNALNSSQTSFDKIGRFRYLSNHLPPAKAWILYECILRKNAGKLAAFVKVRDVIEKLTLSGDAAGINEQIDKWIADHGESLWALRVKTYALVEMGASTEADELCQSAHKRCPSAILRLIISRIQSLTVSNDANFTLKSAVQPLVKEFRVAGSSMLGALISGIFCPLETSHEQDISEALNPLQLLPLVDQYEFLVNILMRMSAANGEKINAPASLLSTFETWGGLTNDPTLLLNLRRIKGKFDCEYSPAGRLILNMYERGDYQGAITEFNLQNEKIDNTLAYVNILGKAHAYLSMPKCNIPPSPLQKLVDATIQIYSLMPNSSLAEDRIRALAIKLNFLRLSASISLCGLKARLPKFGGSALQTIAVSKLAQCEKSEFTPLVDNFENPRQDLLADIPVSEVPAHRTLRRRIRASISSNCDPKDTAALIGLLTTESCLQKDYLELYSSYCISIGRQELLVEFAASYICANIVTTACFPMEELVNFIEERRLSTIGACIVAYSYVKEINDSRDMILNEAFEDFLTSSGARRPSEILELNNKLTDQEVMFFRDICVTGTLDYLSCFKSRDELNAERVLILDRLLELNIIEPARRRRELEDLINKSIYDAAANTMNGAKIYVDDAAIKGRVYDEAEKIFALFKSIAEDEPAVEELIALQVANDPTIGDEEDLPKKVIVKSAKSAAALKMWILVKDAFKEDEKFGLDKNLSAEVRHGFFSNLIRSKLEERQLLTERDETGEYSPNLGLRMANPLVLPRIWLAIDKVFSAFSEAINSAIENAEAWMKVQGDENDASDGILLSLTNIELGDLKFIIANSKDAHQPIDAILDLLWSKVDVALSEIRNRLNVEFRGVVDSAFARLESDLDLAKEGVPLLEIVDAIEHAHASFIADLDTTVGWFHRASSNYLPASGVDYLIDIAVRAFERVNSLKGVASIETSAAAGRELRREAAKPFVIALINIFDNCLMHSGYGRGTKFSIQSRATESHISIEIINKLTDSRLQDLDVSQLERINEKARSERNSILVKSEGGSGTIKAYREITNSVPRSDVTFDVRESCFIARITL